MSRVAILIGVTAMVVGSQFSASAMNPRAPYKYVYCSGYLNQTDFMSVFSSVFYSKTDEETLKAAMKKRVQAKYPSMKNITCYATGTDTEEYARKLLATTKENTPRKADLDFSY